MLLRQWSLMSTPVVMTTHNFSSTCLLRNQVLKTQDSILFYPPSASGRIVNIQEHQLIHSKDYVYIMMQKKRTRAYVAGCGVSRKQRKGSGLPYGEQGFRSIGTCVKKTRRQLACIAMR